jgi:membrane protease YdiL (CAAX protease family)
MGQLLLIALPEEAFYRGYLQTRLDDAWTPRWRVLGATLGPGVLVSCAIFAVGHVITIPNAARLAVFFPALAFGWLRARTGGIGAALVFHALCNLYSELLGHGFAVY